MKNTWLSLLICVGSTWLVNLMGGTVLYVNFEAGTNRQPVSAIQDASTNQLNGTVKAPLGYTADVPATVYSNRLAADLSGDWFNYGNVAHDDRFNLTEFTLECFIKPFSHQAKTGDQPDGHVVMKQWSTGWGNFLNTYGLYYQDTDATNGSMSANISFGAWSGYSVVSGPFNKNAWHHIALTLGRIPLTNQAEFSIYVDYQLAQRINIPLATNQTLQYGPAPFRIGSGYFGDSDTGPYRHNYEGLVDEIRLSDTALQPSEFLQASNLGVVMPARFTSVAPGPEGTALTLDGPAGLRPWLVEYSTNMTNWSLLSLITNMAGGISIMDSNPATAEAMRCYRAKHEAP